jgi:hypothetical protein
MKNFKLFFLGFIILLNTSCKKEIDHAAVINALRLGSWKVAYYAEGQIDETSQFAGYVFVFNEDGTATAQNGTVITAGTWMVSNGNYSTKLTLHFDDTDPLAKLNRDWHVDELTGGVVVTQQSHGSADLTLARI